jgi:hypothetical protein
VFVSTWNILGRRRLRPPLPDFAALLKQYDKNGDGKISEAEFPEETLVMTARPELEKIPRSQNYVGIPTVWIETADNFLERAEWETDRIRVSEMMQDHGLLAIRPDGDKAEVIWREKTSIPEIPLAAVVPGSLYSDSKRAGDTPAWTPRLARSSIARVWGALVPTSRRPSKPRDEFYLASRDDG